LASTEPRRHFGVTDFILFHLMQDFSGASVLWRQASKMVVEMALHLTFGFCQETKVPVVTQLARQHADGQ
jgi:hypothetical protein